MGGDVTEFTPARSRRLIDDIDAANNWSRSTHSFTHLDRRPMRLEISSAAHRTGAVGRQRWVSAAVCEYETPTGWDIYNLVLEPGDRGSTVCGQQIRAGDVFSAAGGAEGVLCAGGVDFHEIIVPAGSGPPRWGLWRPDPTDFLRLVRLAEQGHHIARDDAVVCRTFQASIDDALMLAARAPTTDPPRESNNSAVVDIAIAAVVEDAAASVHEMAAAAGVSRATLYRHFERVLGISPYRFIQLRRLSRIRAQLLATPPSPGRVTTIAAEEGVHHLGDLSRTYRERFGERPSDTIPRRNAWSEAPAP